MPEAAETSLAPVRVAMAGYGTVGRALHRIFHDQRERIETAIGRPIILVGVCRRDKFAVAGPDDTEGLPLGTGKIDWKPGDAFEMFGALAASGGADLFVEASPTDLQTGQPALGHVKGAIREGMHVVLANKGPLVVAFHDIMERAQEAGVSVRFEATVGGCIPVLGPAGTHFAGDTIHRLEGILNGTTNFILSRMAEEGSDLEQALREAQQLGYAETDPSGDVDGWDAAAKVVILSNAVLGRNIGLDDVEITGIGDISRQAVELASAHHHRIRLIAEASRDGTARVGPRLVPIGSPLDVDGALNAVRFSTDLTGQVTHVGFGAGGKETAAAILADILATVRQSSQSP